MNPLISVIVPIYKVEQYLDKCITSIVNQTYKNLEIILVDDGSPDNCPTICDKWKELDNRIIVIHKENGGLSDARNAGLDICKGEYIAFVDSDDYISKYYIELLYKGIYLYNVDISACDLSVVYEDDEYHCLQSKDDSDIILLTNKEALSQISQGLGVRTVAWNKLYKSFLLKNERFMVGKYHEDEFFTYKVIDTVDKVAWISNKLYYYLQRKGSIMSTVSIKHLDYLEALLSRISYYKDKYEDLYLSDKVTFCIGCVNFYIESFSLIKGKELYILRDRIKDYRSQIVFSKDELPYISFNKKIYIYLSKYCLHIFSYALRLLRRIRND